MRDRWKKIIAGIITVSLQFIFLGIGIFTLLMSSELIIDTIYVFWFLPLIIGVFFDVITRFRKRILWKRQNVRKFEVRGGTLLYPKNLKGLPVYIVDSLLLAIQLPIFFSLLIMMLLQAQILPFWIPIIIIVSSVVSYSIQTKRPFRTMKWLSIGVFIAFLVFWSLSIISSLFKNKPIVSPILVLWMMVFIYFIFRMSAAFVDTHE